MSVRQHWLSTVGFGHQYGDIVRVGLIASCDSMDSRYEWIHKSIFEGKTESFPIEGSFKNDVIQWYIVICKQGTCIIEVHLHSELFANDVILREQAVPEDGVLRWESFVRHWEASDISLPRADRARGRER